MKLITWIKNNLVKVLLAAFLLVLLVGPFVYPMIASLRAKVPGLKDINPKSA